MAASSINGLSKAEVIKCRLSLLAVVGGLCYYLYYGWLHIPTAPVRSAAKLQAALECVHRDLGIRIVESKTRHVVKSGGETAVFKPLSPKYDASAYESIILDELDLYPPSLLKASRLCRIVLVNSIEVDGTETSALSDRSQHVIYLPVFEDSILDPFMVRRGFQHEMGHLLDHAARAGKRWPAWEKANPKGFRYATDGVDAWIARANKQRPDGADGFAAPYAMASLSEDVAETYSCMVVYPAYCQQRAVHDAALKTKLDLVHNALTRLAPDGVAPFEAAAKAHAKMCQPNSFSRDPDRSVRLYREYLKFMIDR